MAKKYKISELAQLWGCSVPTVHKRVEKEGYKTVQALDEQNKMVKYVIIDDVENVVNYVENDVNNDLKVSTIKKEENMNKFVDSLISLLQERDNRLEQKNNELAEYKITKHLLEDKKAREGLLINENRELKKEQKNLQKINEYFKIGLSIALIIIFSLTVYVFTVNKMIKQYSHIENVENPTK